MRRAAGERGVQRAGAAQQRVDTVAQPTRELRRIYLGACLDVSARVPLREFPR
jgi:hypothetical protein